MAKQRIKREKNFDTGHVKFTVIETGADFEINVNDLPEDIKTSLLVHGVNAKVGDSAADPKVDAMEAMQGTWEQLKSGVWAARSSGDGSARITILAEALQKVTGQELEAVQAKLADMSDEEKKDLRLHGQVKSAIADIKAEKAKAAAKSAAKDAKAGDEEDELNF